MRARLLRALVRTWMPQAVRNALNRAFVDLERFHPPRAVARPPGQRPLLLAPHPDDESIACGGTLTHYVRAGAAVSVVFLTDGRLGDPQLRRLPRASPERTQREDALVALRRREAEAALAVLGITDFSFLAARDGELGEAVDEVGARLAGILERVRPDVVLLPFLTDRHADHFAANRCLMNAAERLGPGWIDGVECLGYEVWSPIYANLSVDISACMESKRRAVACHASQLRHEDYLAGIEGLNRYRAVSGRVGGDFAEAFFSAPLSTYRTLFRQLLL